MSGGIAYVLDESGDFGRRLNTQMVAAEGLAEHEEIAAGKITYNRTDLEPAEGETQVLSADEAVDSEEAAAMEVVPETEAEVDAALAADEAPTPDKAS